MNKHKNFESAVNNGKAVDKNVLRIKRARFYLKSLCPKTTLDELTN